MIFLLLRNSTFNFDCYTQREATPTQKSARKWRRDLSRLLARKITKGVHSCKPASPNRPIGTQNIATVPCVHVCEPVWPSGKASVRIRFGSPFSSKVVVCGHCLVTLSLTIYETLKRHLSLPILMHESFMWWQCSDRYINSLSPDLQTPSPLLPVPNKPYGFCGR